MVVNGSLAGPEIHFELRYYFALNELFITNFYCIGFLQLLQWLIMVMLIVFGVRSYRVSDILTGE